VRLSDIRGWVLRFIESFGSLIAETTGYPKDQANYRNIELGLKDL
jgi:hypothetical protein